jgi:DNA-directed RNA polymerase specialized sigma24 family protein
MARTASPGDAEALFRDLYAEHGPALLRLTTALTGGDRGRAALVALPRSQYQVLAEIYYRDQSVAEAARLLHIPPGTVRSRTFYGVRALRRALAADTAAA